MNVDVMETEYEDDVAATPVEPSQALEHVEQTSTQVLEPWTHVPRGGDEEYHWLPSDADDRKNSIIGYLVLASPILITLLGLIYVTR